MRMFRFLRVFSASTTAIIVSFGMSLVPAKALQIPPSTSAGNGAIVQVRDGGHGGFSGHAGGGGSALRANSGSARVFGGENFQNFRAGNLQNFRSGSVHTGTVRTNNIQVSRSIRNNPNVNQNFVRSSRLAHHRHHRYFVGIPYYDLYDDYGYDYGDYDDYGYGNESCVRLVPHRHQGHVVWRRIYVCS